MDMKSEKTEYRKHGEYVAADIFELFANIN